MLSNWIQNLSRLGTGGLRQNELRYAQAANLTAAAIAVACFMCALVALAVGGAPHRAYISGNFVILLLNLGTPLFHRLGRRYPPIWIFLVTTAGLAWISSQIGSQAGIMLNMVATPVLAFLMTGRKHVRTVVALTVCAAAAAITVEVLFDVGTVPQPFNPTASHLAFAAALISVLAISFVVYLDTLTRLRAANDATRSLLLATMPEDVADRLISSTDQTLVDEVPYACVVFADIAGFVNLSNTLGATATVDLLDELFGVFDDLARHHGVTKIKTIGDAYLAVCGLNESLDDCERRSVQFCFDAMEAAGEIGNQHGLILKLRAGLAAGPITAGVIGKDRCAYDVWGATVNLAARLESTAEVGHVVTTGRAKSALDKHYTLIQEGNMELKGFGVVPAWRVGQPKVRSLAQEIA